MAKSLQDEARYEEAEMKLLEVYKEHPANYEVLYLLGQAQTQLKKYLSAQDKLTKAYNIVCKKKDRRYRDESVDILFALLIACKQGEDYENMRISLELIYELIKQYGIKLDKSGMEYLDECYNFLKHMSKQSKRVPINSGELMDTQVLH